jgi:hypothetical protein
LAARGVEGKTGSPPKRLAGIALNQYQRYFPHPNLWKPA